MGGTRLGGLGVGSVGCPSVTVVVAVMKGWMEQKKANSRASRNVNWEVCRLFSVPLSQLSVLSAGTPEVVVCGGCPDSPSANSYRKISQRGVQYRRIHEIRGCGSQRRCGRHRRGWHWRRRARALVADASEAWE